MLRRSVLALTACFFSALLTPGVAHGQVGVYAMASGGFLGAGTASGSFSAYGGTFGLYDNFVRLGPLKLGGDLRYFQDTSSNNSSYDNKLRGGLAGPRLVLSLPLIPFKPYLQAEIGDVATNYGVQSGLNNSFAYQIQGGLDFTIFPHLDLRAEYGGGQIDGYTGGNKRSLQEAGLGLAVRF